MSSFQDIVSWDNLYQSYQKAAKGKRGRPGVAAFEHDLEKNLLDLLESLSNRSYRPGGYIHFKIHEPKERLISAAPFRDRVVHHALCRQIEPVFEKSFIDDSYACRIGRGTHCALDRCQFYSRHYRYVLQCDVKQFFPSVDHAVLESILVLKIKDPNTLWLIGRILGSGEGISDEKYRMTYFPGDDLFAATRPRGLPIGNLTSQFWANVFLNPFDHFIQRELKCPAYLRYVDDFLLFSDSKKQLMNWRNRIVQRLQDFRLLIHSGAHPRPVAEGIPFLGFQVFPESRRLKRRKGIHFSRKYRLIQKKFRSHEVSMEQLNLSVKGWINHVRYGNTVGLRKSILNPGKR